MLTLADLPIIGFLCFLEGILSIDNAVVLAVMVKHLPHAQQRKALTYGLLGAVFFRLVCLSFATHLMAMHWVKVLGGAYLLYIAGKHFLGNESEDSIEKRRKENGFWKTVVLVELMDIAFAVDSILAAVAVSQKLPVVFIGGMAGVVVIRFAASGFVRILERFPRFESAAFLMIIVIGLKIAAEGLELPLDFEHPTSPWFWGFWTILGVCFLTGFLQPKPKRKRKS